MFDKHPRDGDCDRVSLAIIFVLHIRDIDCLLQISSSNIQLDNNRLEPTSLLKKVPISHSEGVHLDAFPARCDRPFCDLHSKQGFIFFVPGY